MVQTDFAYAVQNISAMAERRGILAGDPAKKAEIVQKTQIFLSKNLEWHGMCCYISKNIESIEVGKTIIRCFAIRLTVQATTHVVTFC